jgi:cytoskeletal protein CcmA (bactofilin family)
LLAPSVITGTVRAPLLIIEEGAQFNGTCEMEKAAPTVVARPAKKDREDDADEVHAASSHHRASRSSHSSTHD